MIKYDLNQVRQAVERLTPEMSDLFEDLNESLNNLSDSLNNLKVSMTDLEDRISDCREHFRNYSDVVHGFLYPDDNKPDYEERA